MMPTMNARKHVIPSGGEATITRETLYQSFGNSIRDVVPVENVTERALLVAALTAAGEGPSPSRPLLVFRADAPGLHRVEVTENGSVWVPASGVLRFSSKSAADSFATANASLLSLGDMCYVDRSAYVWSELGSSSLRGWRTWLAPVGAVIPTPGAEFDMVGNSLNIRDGRLLGTINFSRKSGTITHGDTIMTLPSVARPPALATAWAQTTPAPSQLLPLAVTAAGVISAPSPPAGRTAGTITFDMAIV